MRQILIVGRLCSLLGFSYGDKPYFDNEILPAVMPHLAARGTMVFSKYRELSSYSYWAIAKLLGFGLLPLLHLRLLGEARRGLWPALATTRRALAVSPHLSRVFPRAVSGAGGAQLQPELHCDLSLLSRGQSQRL